jgi:hypothetical protein
MKPAFLLALLITSSCAGSAPQTSTPGEEPRPAPTAADGDTQPAQIASPAPVDNQPTGRKVWELIPDAPHGQCCKSDDECGPITCEPYEYGHAGCAEVCTYSCEPGDLCPQLGGTTTPPSPCPESGLCPVGPPYV